MEANGKSVGKKFQKSYFDVLGLCCTSEVPLIEKILNSLDGVKGFSVIVPTKTVVVVHDSLLISQIQIVKALNQARLEANIRAFGETNYKNKWPSPYAIACGTLLLLSFLKYFYNPLRWLAVAAIAVGILPVLLKAFAAVRNLTLDINILVLIAVSGSLALHDYWEAATIVFLFTIAEWLESRASHKATAVMSSLVSVVPQRAVLAETGEEVNADEVKLGSVLAVKAGEVIPIDGVVVDGKCEVDEKFLTGESFPVAKQIDDVVWASTINLNGYITVKTTAIADDCVVARMAKLVEDSQNNKSKTQRVIDKCAKYYTPAIVVISASLAIVPLLLHVQDTKKWYHLALVVLVSGCPCSLLLSTPVAMFCALSKAAGDGVLFKGAEHLETLARIKIMAFDKTGTITRGEFVVSDFKSLHDNISLDTLLYWISSIESKSSHPMAAALVDFARSHTVDPKSEQVEKFEIFPGEGIYGRIEDNDVYVGNWKVALRAGCSTAVPKLEGYNVEGKSIGYVFVGPSLSGIFCLSDACRTGAKEALKELKSMGIKTVMLTGDSYAAAKHAQSQLGGGLDEVHAELLPEDKERIVKELQKTGPTAMIGDGVNDAPALATSDIGISMGVAGSALATETGDVVLMSNDIRRIPKAYKIARKVQRKIIENVVISISTKAAIIGLGIAGHPLVWAAVLTDVGTCLLVIFNSMLLLRGVDGHDQKCGGAHRNHHHAHDSHAHKKNNKCSSSSNNNNNKNSPCASKCGSGSSSCKDKKCSSSGQEAVTTKAIVSHKCCQEVVTKDLESQNVVHTHGSCGNGGAAHEKVHGKCCKKSSLSPHDHDHDHDHDHEHEHEHGHKHEHKHVHEHEHEIHGKKCMENHCGEHKHGGLSGKTSPSANKHETRCCEKEAGTSCGGDLLKIVIE
ncbi:hypothetical protein ABFX02_10G073900 [Erythranthe guttata]